MKRPDWRDHLHAYLDRCEDVPFSWTSHNCMTFATGAVVAMTGVDHWWQERKILEGMGRRGRVLRYMSDLGADLEQVTGRMLRRAQAQPRRTPGEGDVIIARHDGVPCVGICLGRLSVFAGIEGIVYCKTRDVIAAWRVG